MTLCVNCGTICATNAGKTQCDGCQGTVHLSCIGISEKEATMTRSKSKSIKIVCNQCNNNMSCLKDLRTLITSLQHELSSSINQLKTEFQSQLDDINVKLTQSSQQRQSTPVLEEVVQEVLERQKRAKNIVIFNLPEQSNNSSDEIRKENDNLLVKNVLNITNPNVDFENFSVRRMGRFNESRNRPIKVFFKNESDVFSVVRSSKNLKNDLRFKNVNISFDRTPKQLELYNQLKTEMNGRIARGESNLKIGYYNGTPKIIRLN